MMRLLLVGLFGYATYRLARAFVRSVPGDFEPVGLLPPPETSDATTRAKARRTTSRGNRRK
jgi:hypothetical protein